MSKDSNSQECGGEETTRIVLITEWLTEVFLGWWITIIIFASAMVLKGFLAKDLAKVNMNKQRLVLTSCGPLLVTPGIKI